MRGILPGLSQDRLCLQGERSGELPGRSGLEATGVRVVTVPGTGHNMMFGNAEVFAVAVAGRL